MNVTRNVIPPDHIFGKRYRKNWEEYCETSYDEVKSILKHWQNPDYSARPLTRSYYIKVFDCSLSNFTGLASENALKNKLNKKKVVYDHCLSPQFVTRMVLDNPKIYLDDYNQFKSIFWDCCRTIMVTQEENIALSKLSENDGYYYRIHVPTHLKYQHLGINLFFRPTLKGKWKDTIPMETNIIDVPENLKEYEKYFLV